MFGITPVFADYATPECDETTYWYCDNSTDCGNLTGNYEWNGNLCIYLDSTTHTQEIDALNEISESLLVLRSHSESLNYILKFFLSLILTCVFVFTFIGVVRFIRHFFNPNKIF